VTVQEFALRVLKQMVKYDQAKEVNEEKVLKKKKIISKNLTLDSSRM